METNKVVEMSSKNLSFEETETTPCSPARILMPNVQNLTVKNVKIKGRVRVRVYQRIIVEIDKLRASALASSSSKPVESVTASRFLISRINSKGNCLLHI